MIKKILLIVFVLFCTIFCIIRTGIARSSKSDFAQVLNKYFIGDEITVEASSVIDDELIKITDQDGKVFFENNEFFDNIGENYGGPIFDVYYNNKLIGKGLHDNKNDWYTSEYVFNFFKVGNKVRFKLTTIGKQGPEEGYIWIDKINNKSHYQSFESTGQLISEWYE